MIVATLQGMGRCDYHLLLVEWKGKLLFVVAFYSRPGEDSLTWLAGSSWGRGAELLRISIPGTALEFAKAHADARTRDVFINLIRPERA